MNSKNFISAFISRQGLYVLSSNFGVKIISFITSIIIIRILSKSEYGLVSYAVTILAFVAPFAGAGLYQGFLRYGSLSESQLNKKVLFGQLFFKGLKWSIAIVSFLLLLSPIITHKVRDAQILLIIISFQVISFYLLQMIQVYCRLINNNKLYSYINLYTYGLLFITNILGCFFWGGVGYVVSMVITPLIISGYYLFKLGLLNLYSFQKTDYYSNKEYNYKDVFLYGIHMSIGGVLSQLLFATDILLIGNLLSDSELLAQYKASSIIPLSLMILGSSVLASDFVKLAGESKKNATYLSSYYFSYLKIFTFISLFFLLVFYFFSDKIMLLFGSEYSDNKNLIFIFSIGLAGALMFRIPMGNMLSAIGWPKTNTILSLIVLILNIIIGYFMILNMGIKGAAITTSALLWVSGLFSLAAFIYFLKTSKQS